MATFDQALTESALIAIPILLFLLGLGLFKWIGDNGAKVISPTPGATPKPIKNGPTDPAEPVARNPNPPVSDPSGPNPPAGGSKKPSGKPDRNTPDNPTGDVANAGSIPNPNNDPANPPDNANNKKNPDGNTSHPDGSTTHPDGSTTHPDDRKTSPDRDRKNPDGSTSDPAADTQPPPDQNGPGPNDNVTDRGDRNEQVHPPLTPTDTVAGSDSGDTNASGDDTDAESDAENSKTKSGKDGRNGPGGGGRGGGGPRDDPGGGAGMPSGTSNKAGDDINMFKVPNPGGDDILVALRNGNPVDARVTITPIGHNANYGELTPPVTGVPADWTEFFAAREAERERYRQGMWLDKAQVGMEPPPLSAAPSRMAAHDVAGHERLDRRAKVDGKGGARPVSPLTPIKFHDPGRRQSLTFSPSQAKQKVYDDGSNSEVGKWRPRNIPQDEKAPVPVAKGARKQVRAGSISPEGTWIDLVSPEKAAAVDLAWRDSEREMARRRLELEKSKRQEGIDTTEKHWVKGEDGIYELQDVKARPRSTSIDKLLKAEADDVSIILGDPGKVADKIKPVGEKVELVRVRGPDGKIGYMTKSKLEELKASPIDAEAKAAVEVDKANTPAKTTVEDMKEEVLAKKEMVKLQAELAELNKDTAKPGVEGEDKKSAEAERIKRMKEIKLRMEQIKAARDEDVWKKVDAELTKAERSKVAGDREAPGQKEEIISPERPSTFQDSVSAPVPSPISRVRRRRDIQEEAEGNSSLNILVYPADVIIYQDVESIYAPSGVVRRTRADAPSRRIVEGDGPQDARRVFMAASSPVYQDSNDLETRYRTPGESVGGVRNETPNQMRDINGQQSDSVTGSHTRKTRPIDQEIEQEQSQLALSQSTGVHPTDGSIAPSDRAASSVRDQNTLGAPSSRVGAHPSPLDLDEVKNLQKLEDKGEIQPGESVSAVGENEATPASNIDKVSKSGVKSTAATAEKHKHELPAAMSHIGKKAQTSVVADKNTVVESATNPEIDESAVDLWLKDAKSLLNAIDKAVIKGFPNVKVHEAWHIDASTQSEELANRWEGFSDEDQERCRPEMDRIDSLLNEQAKLIDNKEALKREELSELADVPDATTAPAASVTNAKKAMEEVGESSIKEQSVAGAKDKSSIGPHDRSEEGGGRKEDADADSDTESLYSGHESSTVRSDHTKVGPVDKQAAQLDVEDTGPSPQTRIPIQGKASRFSLTPEESDFEATSQSNAGSRSKAGVHDHPLPDKMEHRARQDQHSEAPVRSDSFAPLNIRKKAQARDVVEPTTKTKVESSSAIEYDPEDLYEERPCTRVNGQLVPVQTDQTDNRANMSETSIRTAGPTEPTSKKLSPELPSLQLVDKEEKTESRQNLEISKRPNDLSGKKSSAPEAEGQSPDLYDSGDDRPLQEKREKLGSKPTAEDPADSEFPTETKHLGRKASLKRAPLDLKAEPKVSHLNLAGKPEQNDEVSSPDEAFEELKLKGSSGSERHQAKELYPLRPDHNEDKMRNSSAADKLAPRLEEYVKHDAHQQEDIAVNRMMLPTESESRERIPEENHSVEKDQKQSSRAPLVFPKEFISQSKSREAPNAASAWTSKSRVQEIQKSGSVGLQKRRIRWETAWQERAKAWFHAHGPLSEAKQRATNARQEQDWARIALLSGDEEGSEFMEYIQDTKILLSRPAFFGMSEVHAPGSDARPPYKPSPEEEQARWEQFSKLWKEEQASFDSQGRRPPGPKRNDPDWNRVANLPPGEFASAMYDYRRKNDRLPWAPRKVESLDEDVGSDAEFDGETELERGDKRQVRGGRDDVPQPDALHHRGKQPRTKEVQKPKTAKDRDGSEQGSEQGDPATRDEDLPGDRQTDSNDPSLVAQPLGSQDDVMAQKASAKEKYRRLQEEQKQDYQVYNAAVPQGHPSDVQEFLRSRRRRREENPGAGEPADEDEPAGSATTPDLSDVRSKRESRKREGRRNGSSDAAEKGYEDPDEASSEDQAKGRKFDDGRRKDSENTLAEKERRGSRSRQDTMQSDDSNARTVYDDEDPSQDEDAAQRKTKDTLDKNGRKPTLPDEVNHKPRKKAEHTYPPSETSNSKSRKSSGQASQEPLPSLFNLRPILRSFTRYVMNAKLLAAILILQCVISVLGARQLTTLVTLPAGGSTASGALDKRAPDDLPIDIRYTQKWLVKMLGGTVNPTFAFILLMTWICLCILMSGIIYNFILEKTDNPTIISEEDKQKKWCRNKTKTCKSIWRWHKSCLVSAVRLVLMDRHPSVKACWKKSGWWTLVRIGLFTTQLLVAIIIVRHVCAMASLVAGSETPIPTGIDINLTLDVLKDALPMMTPYPSGTMLLVGSVLSGVLVIIPVGWHSLLHPRPKNPNASSASKTMFRILTCQAFGSGIKLAGWKYNALLSFLAILLVAVFAACLVYFVEIMTYVGDNSFVKKRGYVDSVGLIGACLIFGIFSLPLAWVALKLEDVIRSASSKRAAGTKPEDEQ